MYYCCSSPGNCVVLVISTGQTVKGLVHDQVFADFMADFPQKTIGVLESRLGAPSNIGNLPSMARIRRQT